MTTGQAIRAWRKHRGLTQQEAAARAGPGWQSQWSEIETGHSEPELATLDRIAAALSTSAPCILLTRIDGETIHADYGKGRR